MSNALVLGFVAVVASAATVVGLEASGVASEFSSRSNQPSVASIADSSSLEAEMKDRIATLEHELETIRNSSATSSDITGLRTRVSNVEMVAQDAFDLASTRPEPTDTGSAVIASAPDEAEIETLVNEMIEAREAEDAAKKKAEQEAKQAANREKARTKFVEGATKQFRKMQERDGITEFQVTEAIRLVVSGFDVTNAYMDDVHTRRDQGQEVAGSEVSGERKRIKTETSAALELLFSRDEWVKVEKLYNKLPTDTLSVNRMNNSRNSVDTARKPNNPRENRR